jgi:hypothetical protein
MNALTAPDALEKYFLEARCKLLDLAAMLDRVTRGEQLDQAKADPRLARIHQALTILASASPNRAEQVQQLFSLGYDPSWKRPEPR